MKLLHFTNSLTFDVKIMFRLRACVHGHGFVRACVRAYKSATIYDYLSYDYVYACWAVRRRMHYYYIWYGSHHWLVDIGPGPSTP